MLIKEYRIPLPLTLDEYRVAQIYMIDKKSRTESHKQSGDNEDAKSGVEVRIINKKSKKNEHYSLFRESIQA